MLLVFGVRRKTPRVTKDGLSLIFVSPENHIALSTPIYLQRRAEFFGQHKGSMLAAAQAALARWQAGAEIPDKLWRSRIVEATLFRI